MRVLGENSPVDHKGLTRPVGARVGGEKEAAPASSSGSAIRFITVERLTMSR